MYRVGDKLSRVPTRPYILPNGVPERPRVFLKIEKRYRDVGYALENGGWERFQDLVEGKAFIYRPEFD